jgi:hypothetical protein
VKKDLRRNIASGFHRRKFPPPPTREYLDSLQCSARKEAEKHGEKQALEIIREGLAEWPELIAFEYSRAMENYESSKKIELRDHTTAIEGRP